MIDREKLLSAAMAARGDAYAPYSAFTVGAALLSKNGRIYTGCNVENASYGATCCAERVALFSAIANGDREFEALALVGGHTSSDAATPCYPCGICRQVLSEFCKADLPVFFGDGSETTLGELLPNGFSLT